MQEKQPMTSDSHPIFLNFLDYWGQGKGKLGITFAPGKKQPKAYSGCWDRDLNKDLTRFKQFFQIGTLVSFLQQHQSIRLKIENQLEQCEKIGIKAFNFPVVDNSIPDDKQKYKLLVKEIVDNHILKGKQVAIHCMGGLGRAPTFAAACLIYSGVPAKEAIEMVRQVRNHSLDVSGQLNFLKNLTFD